MSRMRKLMSINRPASKKSNNNNNIATPQVELSSSSEQDEKKKKQKTNVGRQSEANLRTDNDKILGRSLNESINTSSGSSSGYNSHIMEAANQSCLFSSASHYQPPVGSRHHRPARTQNESNFHNLSLMVANQIDKSLEGDQSRRRQMQLSHLRSPMLPMMIDDDDDDEVDVHHLDHREELSTDLIDDELDDANNEHSLACQPRAMMRQHRHYSTMGSHLDCVDSVSQFEPRSYQVGIEPDSYLGSIKHLANGGQNQAAQLVHHQQHQHHVHPTRRRAQQQQIIEPNYTNHNSPFSYTNHHKNQAEQSLQYVDQHELYTQQPAQLKHLSQFQQSFSFSPNLNQNYQFKPVESAAELPAINSRTVGKQTGKRMQNSRQNLTSSSDLHQQQHHHHHQNRSAHKRPDSSRKQTLTSSKSVNMHQVGQPSLGCCGKLAKSILFIANILFWMTGVALGAWGILSLVEDHKYNLSQLLVFEPNSRMSLFQLLSWSFITLACASILVGFCGCSAIFKNNRWILGLYIFLILAIFALDLATGLLAIIFQERLVTKVRLRLVNKLRTEYGVQASFTAAIDYIQTKFECCGLDGHFDYDQSLWRLQRLGGFDATVARTCCHLRNTFDDQAHINPRPVNESMCQSTDVRFHQSYRYRKGCLDDLERLVRHKIWTFTMGCAAVGCVILFSLLFATCFCRSIPSSSSSSRRNSATTTTTDKKQISQTVSKQQMLQIQSNAQHSGKHYR